MLAIPALPPAAGGFRGSYSSKAGSSKGGRKGDASIDIDDKYENTAGPFELVNLQMMLIASLGCTLYLARKQ